VIRSTVIIKMSKITNFVEKTTVKAVINGKVEVITPAYTDFSMEQPKDKNNLMSMLDKEKMLDVIFHFAEPQVFWKEDFTLRDINGIEIPKNTPNVYVVCDTGDTYWRVFLDEELKNVEIHTFDTVKDFAQTIGQTMLYSRSLNNVEKIGVAALATDNEAYMTCFRFAKEHKIPMNTAKLYLKMSMKPLNTSIMTMGVTPVEVPTMERSLQDAEELYTHAEAAFASNARKRYVPNALNALLGKGGYSKELVVQALMEIPASSISDIMEGGCEGRESCIFLNMTTLINQIKERNRLQQAA